MSPIFGGAETRQRLAKLERELETIDRKLSGIGERLDLLLKETTGPDRRGRGERNGAPDRSEEDLIRSLPGRLLDPDDRCLNPAYVELARHARDGQVDEALWHKVLAEALAEAAGVEGASQVFERRAYVQDYLSALSRKHRAKYEPGWVDLESALFLYWLVRQTRPRRILQCGAQNGLSSAFMMLALAKNGSEGRLLVIDTPSIFDPNEAAWRKEGAVFSGVVPEGKQSAWLVPDRYQDRVVRVSGDASRLEEFIDDPAGIDLFYYADDHAYRRMTAAFETVKARLRPGGLVVTVDVGWSSSLWNFAQGVGAPSYTFRNTLNVAFL